MSPTNIPSAREALDRQIARLNDRQRARKYQDALLKEIRGDRGRRGRYRYNIDPINLGADFAVAVGGEVLVVSKDLAKATPILTKAGFARVEPMSSIKALDERVARFRKDGASVEAAARVVDDLLKQRVDASVNYVLPLGYVAKGEGGFEFAPPIQRQGPGANPGTGAKVAVIDTGIVKTPRNDGWLENITRHDPENIDVLYQGPPAPPDLLDFGAGHGTFVTGIIQQVAPTAQIRMYRAIGSDGIGNDVQVAEAILQAASEGAQIINLSLGTPARGEERPVATQEALKILAEDILVVAAAGNSPDTQPFYPAAFEQVTAVAGLTANLRLRSGPAAVTMSPSPRRRRGSTAPMSSARSQPRWTILQ